MPDVSGKQVFGAKALVHMSQQLRRNQLSTGGTFIGHEPDPKAYRVLVSNGKVEVFRNVMLHKSMPAAADGEAALGADRITTTICLIIIKRLSPLQPLTTQKTVMLSAWTFIWALPTQLT